MQCVTAELFTSISVSISSCVQEKVLRDSAFKMSDLSEEAVKDVMTRLKEKRTMNNKEVTYLMALFQRARHVHHDRRRSSLVYLLIYNNDSKFKSNMFLYSKDSCPSLMSVLISARTGPI